MSNILIRTNVCLSERNREALKNAAGDLRIPPAQLLRDIIEQHFAGKKSEEGGQNLTPAVIGEQVDAKV